MKVPGDETVSSKPFYFNDDFIYINMSIVIDKSKDRLPQPRALETKGPQTPKGRISVSPALLPWPSQA